MKNNIEFMFHWMDMHGVMHFTGNKDEAEKALHSGHQIFLVVKNGRHHDGTDRRAE